MRLSQSAGSAPLAEPRCSTAQTRDNPRASGRVVRRTDPGQNGRVSAPDSRKSSGPVTLRVSPLRVGLFYALFAVLWIVLSDRVLHAMGLEPERSNLLQTLKGWRSCWARRCCLHADVPPRTRPGARALAGARRTVPRAGGTSPDGVFISSDRKLAFCNPAFARMLGAGRRKTCSGAMCCRSSIRTTTTSSASASRAV